MAGRRFAEDVIVIGAGIAGICAALALAKAGQRVALVERDAVPFNRASLRNEGKIHLGLIYAAERGRATADLQLRGALHFSRLLRQWTGGRSDRLSRSRPFAYLVERSSILSPDALSEHYAHVEARCRAALSDEPGLDYLGARPERLVRPMSRSDLADHFAPDRFLAGFHTEEIAIDPAELGEVLVAALRAEDRIALLAGHDVRSAERTASGFRLEGAGPEGRWGAEASQVVNAAWDDLYRLDRQAGLEPPAGWLLRLKYRALAHLPPALREAPSATLVLGPFGDVVVRPDGTGYLSWYPVGLKGWSHDLTPPADWVAACTGTEGPERAGAIGAAILAEIDRWMPGMAGAAIHQVDAGAILAHGRSDVDDPESGLHGRGLSGIASRDGWHSFNPGKLTTAPLFAEEAARVVLGQPSAVPA